MSDELPSPDEFLETILRLVPDTEVTRLGTVKEVLSGGSAARVQFDGENTAGLKPRLCVNYAASLEDRVLLIKAGHSWLILGAIGSV